MLPENAEKPTRRTREAAKLPILVKKLQRQRTKKIYHGLYDYIQINFCYSSNRLASNRLLLTQVEEVYRKGKVSTGFEPIKVDDLIEAYNHFTCVSHIIDTAAARISQSYIRKLHTMLSYGTMAERKLQFHPGEYRRDTCTIGKTKTTPPKNINSQMNALIAEYESLDKVELAQILDFHVRFERIHPFTDGNGRVGRLLMFKECLRHEITPFILDDKRRTEYLKGIREWDMDKSTLFTPCLEAQARFQAQIDLQKLQEYAQHYKPADYKED
ncbi:MAG: Fic family protein [Firmicutes bacterium]|nr:Fic family protein [Bacillota bacterium]